MKSESEAFALSSKPKLRGKNHEQRFKQQEEREETACQIQKGKTRGKKRKEE